MKYLAGLLLAFTLLITNSYSQAPPHPTGITTCGVDSFGHTYAYTDLHNQEFRLGLAYTNGNLRLGYFIISPNPIRERPFRWAGGDLCVGNPVWRLTHPSQLLTDSQTHIQIPHSKFIPDTFYYFQAYYRGVDGGHYFSDTLRIWRP